LKKLTYRATVARDAFFKAYFQRLVYGVQDARRNCVASLSPTPFRDDIGYHGH